MDILDLIDQIKDGGPEAQSLIDVLTDLLRADGKSQFIRDSEHAIQTRILSEGLTVTTDVNTVGRDVIGTSQFDTLNFISGGGVVRVNSANPRQADIPRGAGGGADCLFHYLVSSCFATLSGFSEGQIFTSLSGCRFKGYSTVQGAITDSLTNPSALGAGDPFTVANDEVAVIAICSGTYAEAITTSSSQQFRLLGTNREAVVIGGATSSNPTLGVAASCRIWISGIEWQCSSASHAISMVGVSGAELEIWDCAINSASSTRIGIESSGSHNWRQLSVHDCTITGNTGVLTNAGNASGTHKIWDCQFNSLTIGVNCDEDTEINNCLFVSCTTAVGIIDGSQGIYVKNNHFQGTGCTAVKFTGSFSANSVERLTIIDNTFGSDIAGITCFFDSSALSGSASTASDTWTIANNHGLSCSTAFLKWTASTWSRTQSWIIRVFGNTISTASTWSTGTTPGFLFSSGNWNGNVPVEGVVGPNMSSQLWYWIDDNDFQFGVIPFTCRFGDTIVQYAGGTFTISTAGTFSVELDSGGTVTVTSGSSFTTGRFPIVQFVTAIAGVNASYVSHVDTAGIPFAQSATGGGTAAANEAFVTIGNSATLSAERALTPIGAYTAVGGVGFVDAGANSTVTATLKDLTANWTQAGVFDISTAGNLTVLKHAAIGSSSAISTTQILSVAETFTNPAGDVDGAGLAMTINLSAGNANNFDGFHGTVVLAGTGSASGIVTGVHGNVQSLSGAATESDVRSMWAQASAGAGKVYTNRYGLYISDGTGSGTFTNQYGLYIENMAKGGTLNRAIYSAGGNSVHAGSFTIGGTATPSTTADIRGAITLDGIAAPSTPASDDIVVYNETGTDFLKAKDDNGAVYNLTAKHLINVMVDGTVTNQKNVVGPMPQAGTIVSSKAKTCDGVTIGATAWVGQCYLIPAANVDTDGGTTTIYTTAPSITNGHMVSTNDVLSTTTFAAGDYFSFATTTVGTSATMIQMGLTIRYT